MLIIGFPRRCMMLSLRGGLLRPMNYDNILLDLSLFSFCTPSFKVSRGVLAVNIQSSYILPKWPPSQQPSRLNMLLIQWALYQAECRWYGKVYRLQHRVDYRWHGILKRKNQIKFIRSTRKLSRSCSRGRIVT